MAPKILSGLFIYLFVMCVDAATCSDPRSKYLRCNRGDDIRIEKRDVALFCVKNQKISVPSKNSKSYVFECKYNGAKQKKRFYKWIDDNGEAQITDKLPPTTCKSSSCNKIFQIHSPDPVWENITASAINKYEEDRQKNRKEERKRLKSDFWFGVQKHFERDLDKHSKSLINKTIICATFLDLVRYDQDDHKLQKQLLSNNNCLKIYGSFEYSPLSEKVVDYVQIRLYTVADSSHIVWTHYSTLHNGKVKTKG